MIFSHSQDRGVSHSFQTFVDAIPSAERTALPLLSATHFSLHSFLCIPWAPALLPSQAQHLLPFSLACFSHWTRAHRACLIISASPGSGAEHDAQEPSKFPGGQKEDNCDPKGANGASELNKGNPEYPKSKKKETKPKVSA